MTDTPSPTAPTGGEAKQGQGIVHRIGALLIPPGHDPVLAAPAPLIWTLLLIFPLLILLDRSGSGPVWWLKLAAMAGMLVALALRFRSAGDGRIRPLAFGITNILLLLLVMGLTLVLIAAVRSILIVYAALPAIVMMLTPRVHSRRDVVIITALFVTGFLLLTGWSQAMLSPAQALDWSDALVLVAPFALVAYTNAWLRRVNRERAATIRRMMDSAQRDMLTGLANRRGLIAAAGRLLPRARERGETAGLLLADMNGLKDINDSFGHGVGDAALRFFGEALRRSAGPDDIIARLGGDEYAVLLVGEPGAPFDSLVQRYIPVLSGTAYRDVGSSRSIMLSASWGVAESGLDGETLENLLPAADERLLWHKARPQKGVAEVTPLMELFVPRGRRALADALNSLMDAARDMATVTDKDEFLKRAAVRVAQITGATKATVTLVRGDETTGYRATWEQQGWENLPSAFPGWASIAGHVLRTGEPYFSNDLRYDPYANQDVVERLGLFNCVCVPMRTADGLVIGTVFLSNKQGRAPFSDLDVSIAQAFSDLATAALAKPAVAETGPSAGAGKVVEPGVQRGA